MVGNRQIFYYILYLHLSSERREREKEGGRKEEKRRKKEKGIRVLYESAGTAMTEYHSLGGLNNRNLFLQF